MVSTKRENMLEPAIFANIPGATDAKSGEQNVEWATTKSGKFMSGSFEQWAKHIVFPEGCTGVISNRFLQAENLESVVFPTTIDSIANNAFSASLKLKTVVFKGTPTSIDSTAFSSCNNLTDIYVPWAEGEVANAPWGATNATIHYNSTI